MRAPLVTANGWAKALRVLPYLTTVGATASGRKRVPLMTAGATPFIIGLRFPFTFRTADSYVAHIKFSFAPVRYEMI